MKKNILILTVLLFSISLFAYNFEVNKEDAKFGVWTMDYDVALSKAKADNKPIFLQFTGSDWCPWCKLMAKNVFSTKVWTDYAKKNLYLVYLDFPRKNPDLVPKKYRNRNQALASSYGVRGFPTYIILDSDGTVLGQLGAGREKTGASFVKEVQRIIRKRPTELKKILDSLPKKIAKKLEKKMKKLQKTKNDLNEWIETKPQRTDKNIKIYNNYMQKIDTLNKEIDAIFDAYAK